MLKVGVVAVRMGADNHPVLTATFGPGEDIGRRRDLTEFDSPIVRLDPLPAGAT